MSDTRPLRVFISYCQAPDDGGSNDGWMKRILDFATKLRGDGIESVIDQFKDGDPASRTLGWPEWMEKQIRDCARVLIVCTERYLIRASGDESPGIGLGAFFEYRMIRNDLYQLRGNNAKYRAVIPSSGSIRHIPQALDGYDYYHFENAAGYRRLLDWLKSTPNPIPPIIMGSIESVAVSASDHSEDRRTAPEAPLSSKATQRFAESHGECQDIPVFGNIMPSISMKDNFINLHLSEMSSQEAAVGHVRHEINFISGDVVAFRETPDVLTSKGERLAERVSTFSAQELWQSYNSGIILGLPGAGKTTILRNFAFLTATAADEEKLVTLLIYCRSLRKLHFDCCKGRPMTAADSIRVLASAFLFPSVESLSELDAGTNYAAEIEGFANFIAQAQNSKRLVILIDAYDEVEPDLRHMVAAWAKLLMEVTAPDRSAEKAEASAATASNRCFISARKQELENLRHLPASVFEVSPLNNEQMREFAKHLYGERSATYRLFDETVWKHPVLRKAGRTPLVSLLLLCYFDCKQTFGQRYEVYDLIMRFVLFKVWDQIKTGRVTRDRATWEQMFRQCAMPDFLESAQSVATRYDALSWLGFSLLFDSIDGAPKREVSEDELTELFALHLHNAGYQEDEAKQLASIWVGDFKSAHLLIASGPKEFVFMHGSFAEFLAARHLVFKLNTGLEPAAKEALSKMATWQGDEADESRAELEALPIACGNTPETSAVLFTSLNGSFNPRREPRQHLQLLFRCLVETEWLEAQLIQPIRTVPVLKVVTERVSRAGDARQWAYRMLADFVATTDSPETLLFTEFHGNGMGFDAQPRLCRDVFPRLFFPEWWAGKPDVLLPCRRELLLVSLLDAKLSDEQRRRRDKLEMAADTPTPLPDFAAHRELSLLRALGRAQGMPGFGLYEVALSEQARFVVAGGAEGIVRLWDITSGDELRTFRGHTGSVFGCALSPDGSSLASGSFDKTLRIWDATTGDERLCIEHEGWVAGCAFSPDGKIIATACEDGKIRLLEVATGELRQSLPGHNEAVHACAFSPDGKLLVSASKDHTARIWNIENGTELMVLAGHKGEVPDACFSPDGTTIVTAGMDHTLRIWSVEDGSMLHTLSGHASYVRSCIFSPDGQRVVSGSGDSTMKLWNMATGVCVHTEPLPGGTGNSLAFGKGIPSVLAVAQHNGTILLFRHRSHNAG